MKSEKGEKKRKEFRHVQTLPLPLPQPQHKRHKLHPHDTLFHMLTNDDFHHLGQADRKREAFS